jgi:hypothetical protein
MAGITLSRMNLSTHLATFILVLHHNGFEFKNHLLQRIYLAIEALNTSRLSFNHLLGEGRSRGLQQVILKRIVLGGCKLLLVIERESFLDAV